MSGELPAHTTATDLVLTCVEMLRKRGVVGKFVEFYGPGVRNLTLADRATIANMAPEYGATMGFFAVDEQSLVYLRQTGRSEEVIKRVEAYLKANMLFRTYAEDEAEPTFSGELVELDLSTVLPSLSGPKRPHDRVPVNMLPKEWWAGLTDPVGFKSYGLAEAALKMEA